MERLYLLAPCLALAGVFGLGLVLFAVLTALGKVDDNRSTKAKHNEFFGPFFGRYLVWMLTPIERLLVGRVSANTITAVSVLMCFVAGFAAATGHLVAAAWTFVVGGILDALDGRIARLSGGSSPAGALFDSVSDRWAELAAFTGFAWYLRDTTWMLAAMAAIAGSMMVSYTRARAEGLGINLTGGMMQRAERIVLSSIGSFIAAWFAISGNTSMVQIVLGSTLLLCGVLSIGTALSRWWRAYSELTKREPKQLAVAKDLGSAPAPLPGPIFPVPAKLRESAELTL